MTGIRIRHEVLMATASTIGRSIEITLGYGVFKRITSELSR